MTGRRPFRSLLFGAWLLAPLALLRPDAQAIAFTVEPTLSNTTIPYETGNTPTGTTVQFSLDGAAVVTVTALQTDGSASDTFNRSFAGAGAYTMFWDAQWPIGSEEGRVNGLFNINVTAAAGGDSVTKTLGPVTINSLGIYNLQFLPSAVTASGGVGFPYQVQFNLAKEALVTARITNSSGTVVRTLVDNQLMNGGAVFPAILLEWNGQTATGTPVPLGVYTVTVEAGATSGSDRAIPRNRTVGVTTLAGSTADFQKLFADSIYVFPNPVRNTGATFRAAALRAGARLSLKIYTIAGDLVREMDFPSVAVGETASLGWDGTNQSGRKVGRGLYYYVVREEDSEGDLSVTKKMAVIP